MYEEIARETRARCPVLLNFSTGAVGIDADAKLAPVERVVPEIAAVNMGSMNYAKYSETRKDFVFDFVFQNPISEIRVLLERMQRVGVRPELECFDTGHVNTISPLVDMGVLAPPFQMNFILGVVGGAPATADALAMKQRTAPADISWAVVGLGLRRRLVAASLSLGGNVRVGAEDNLSFAQRDGALERRKSCRMARDVGREPRYRRGARQLRYNEEPRRDRAVRIRPHRESRRSPGAS